MKVAIALFLSLFPGLLVFPGIDIGAWVLLSPVGFWERLAFFAVALLALWPTVVLAAIVMSFAARFALVFVD